eukprot:m.20218 g.20218  ORF g.20218 m.20218 type:complete len:345 (+) comp8136_c0_seq3:76-1110(+)
MSDCSLSAMMTSESVPFTCRCKSRRQSFPCILCDETEPTRDRILLHLLNSHSCVIAFCERIADLAAYLVEWKEILKSQPDAWLHLPRLQHTGQDSDKTSKKGTTHNDATTETASLSPPGQDASSSFASAHCVTPQAATAEAISTNALVDEESASTSAPQTIDEGSMSDSSSNAGHHEDAFITLITPVLFDDLQRRQRLNDAKLSELLTCKTAELAWAANHFSRTCFYCTDGIVFRSCDALFKVCYVASSNCSFVMQLGFAAIRNHTYSNMYRRICSPTASYSRPPMTTTPLLQSRLGRCAFLPLRPFNFALRAPIILLLFHSILQGATDSTLENQQTLFTFQNF